MAKENTKEDAKDDYTEEETSSLDKDMKEAKRNAKISEYRSKGFSEGDAVKKASKGMVSMKSSGPKEMPSTVGPSSEEEYPYGLCIRLEDEQLDALGITELPKVGSKMKLSGNVTVKSISSNESLGSNSRSVELQITELAAPKLGKSEDSEAA